jgi:hypothetical protein
MDDKIDYRDLLKRYITHVGQCEGSVFIDAAMHKWHSDVKFTAEETAALHTILDEIHESRGFDGSPSNQPTP